jgi:hypothetical protein
MHISSFLGLSDPPNWRWAAALKRVAGQPLAGCTDSLVPIIAQFWAMRMRCRSEHDHQVLAQRMPILSAAFELTSAAHEITRHALEARVLAGEDPQIIGRKMAIDPVVVECYVEVFFDLRHRLDSLDYLLQHVFGPCLQKREWTYDLVWNFLGYVGGPATLEAVMLGRGGSAKPTGASQVGEFLVDVATAAVSRKLAVGALEPGDHRLAAGAVRALTDKVLKSDPEDRSARERLFEQHVAALLNAIPWASGSDDSKVPPEVAEFDELAAELRDHELCHMAAGEPVQGVDMLKQLDMPPPTQ